MKCIILGAGLSGLSCGVALAMDGHQVVIVEKDTEVGGLAKCFRFEGYTFDYGPHLLFGTKVLPLLRDILSPDLHLMAVRRDAERIHFDNRYFRFPFEPKNLLLSMERKRVAGGLFGLLASGLSKKTDHLSVKNLEDWVVLKVGRNLYNYTSMGGYVEKLYGIPPKEVAKDWGIQKLKFLNRLEGANLFQAGLKALTENKTVQSQAVHYPSGGIDQLAFHIARRLTELGGKIFLHSEACAVENKTHGVVLDFEKNGHKKQIEADFLVSTIPVSRLVKMIYPPPPKDIVEVSSLLRYRTLLLVLLCIRKERVLNYQCIYFTEKGIPFRRLTEFKSLDKTMVPEGRTSLCAEITCFEGDTICMDDDQAVYTSVVRELHRHGVIKERDVEHYAVLRIPHAYPVYDIGYRAFLNKVLDYLGGTDRLLSIGRQGLFHYNNMSNSIAAGYEVGKALSVSEEDNFKNLIQDVYRGRAEKYSVL
jgi:protoporphyrinogen oxidase